MFPTRMPHVHNPMIRWHTLALGLLAVALLLVPGATAQSTHLQRGACPHTSSHSSHGTIASRCVKHASHKTKHSSSKSGKHKRVAAKKPAHKHGSSKAASTVPALCEDGNLPVHSGSSFSCEDGSEPACEDGSSPTRSPSGGSVLLCPKTRTSGAEEGEEACEQEAEGECPSGSPFDCEEGEEACQADTAEESEG